MDISAKNLKEQNLRELVHSLELVSARIFDSVVSTSQLASSATPEMRELFAQWVDMIGSELLRITGEEGVISPVGAAAKIGISEDTVISLALALHRQGKIRIKSLAVEPGDGVNKDICPCMS